MSCNGGAIEPLSSGSSVTGEILALSCCPPTPAPPSPSPRLTFDDGGFTLDLTGDLDFDVDFTTDGNFTPVLDDPGGDDPVDPIGPTDSTTLDPIGDTPPSGGGGDIGFPGGGGGDPAGDGINEQ